MRVPPALYTHSGKPRRAGWKPPAYPCAGLARSQTVRDAPIFPGGSKARPGRGRPSPPGQAPILKVGHQKRGSSPKLSFFQVDPPNEEDHARIRKSIKKYVTPLGPSQNQGRIIKPVFQVENI